MEKEINIAEILKDKPQGTKLYDLLYNVDVELDTISTIDTETVVWCTNKTDNNTTCHRGYSEFGTVRGCPDGLQILLPSKEMRDWSKFDWKKGDVLVSNDGKETIFFVRFTDDTYTKFVGKYVWGEYVPAYRRFSEKEMVRVCGLCDKALGRFKDDSITDFERGQWSVIQNVIGYVENYSLSAELCREAGIGYKKIKALQKDCGYSYKEEVNNFLKESRNSGTDLKLED